MRELRDAIDLHTHLNHGSPYDTKTNEIYQCSLDCLMKEYDNAHILCGGYSTFSAVLSDRDVAMENDYLYDLSQRDDRVYQWVVIDPRQEETFLQADKMLHSNKCLGIKIHPGCHGYDIEEHGHKIFSYANEKGTFVLTHPEKIRAMPKFADQYPNMKLIIAHLGSVDHVDAVAAAKHGNIYVDTSGNASVNNNVIEYAVSRVGSAHIFFGTDTYSCAFQRGRIEFACISDADKENILYQNAKRMFSKNFTF